MDMLYLTLLCSFIVVLGMLLDSMYASLKSFAALCMIIARKVCGCHKCGPNYLMSSIASKLFSG